MPRGLIMLVAALVLGGLATWLTAGWLDRAAQANALPQDGAMQTVRILVAATDLKPGDTIGKDMLHWQVWPQVAVRAEHLVEGVADPQQLANAIVRMSVAKGEPLLSAHLVKRGDQGIMAALIAPGHRAITISVSASSGVAGFVGPGDRVDILLTASLQGAGGNRIVGQTVVKSVRVLGIDQRVDPVSAAVLEGEAQASPPATITLEVTPKQAEAVAVAQELGKLSLSLRNLKARQELAGQRADSGKTWDTDVTRLPASAIAGSAFSSAAGALGMAAGGAVAPMPAMAMAAAPVAPMPDGGAAAQSGASGGAGVERVNGVEIVRGSSNRGGDAAPAPVAASVPASVPAL